MENIETLEAALKRIAELERENEKLREELEYYKNRRADKWKCPDTICNVQVSPEQKAAFEAGQAVKMENLHSAGRCLRSHSGTPQPSGGSGTPPPSARSRPRSPPRPST